jgi:hypothetical protein
MSELSGRQHGYVTRAQLLGLGYFLAFTNRDDLPTPRINSHLSSTEVDAV